MSVRTRRARLASIAAAVVLGATVPVLTGASSAWACGDEPAAAAAASTPTVSARATVPADELRNVTVGMLPVPEKEITAGGAPVEFGVEILNTGPGTAKGVIPFPTFYNEASRDGIHGALKPQDLVLEVADGGQWKTLPLKPGCDPVLRADPAFLAKDIEAGRATRFLFRLTVTKHSDASQSQVDIRVGMKSISGGVKPDYDSHLVLPIVHPAAPTTPAPAPSTKAPTTPAPAPTTKAPATSSAPTAQTAVPATAVSPAATSPSATPTTANLASTGGGSSTTPMLVGGTALVLLGAGAVVFARRRAAGTRD
ncbi:LAETG motif-containing sortase-dependent surface protein [Kitasatospora phosalacinea]|uniref:LAETG motif-containing sortase-dependent surface protein n=1 Tax=Kitasatospora phosalacinea TaxID=2065 RepID=UPI0006897EF9|nr:LAETG motif-containing sortase-dependent surface protein [Kitasatospora phosalacinea]